MDEVINKDEFTIIMNAWANFTYEPGSSPLRDDRIKKWG